MAQIDSIPGVSDISPDETPIWRLLESAAHSVFGGYGYGELRAPIFEREEVFLKSIGNETDIVQKEMYSFEDRGGRRLTLRPEGTAGVMRALAAGGINPGEERRVYYLGPMFRGERPAAGRKRQFHQVGVECVGKVAPLIDAECIAMLMDYLAAIGITSNTVLKINSLGDADDRARAGDRLREYFAGHKDALSADSQRRLETNVFRILDSKEEQDQPIIDGAPSVDDLLADESRAYFETVCRGLDDLGITYELDNRLVRGLDYYCHTVWEVLFDGIGAQAALAGGGRYVITPPGSSRSLEGVGFAAGMERLLLARESLGQPVTEAGSVDLYLVGLGEAALRKNLSLAHALRQAGKQVMMDLEGRGMKAQMKAANKCGAAQVLILGESELERGVASVKDMATGDQRDVDLDSLIDDIG